MAIFNSYVKLPEGIDSQLDALGVCVSENSVPLHPMVNDHYPY